MFQDAWRSNKENPSACKGPLMASSYANSDLVLDANHSLDFLGTQEAQFHGHVKEFEEMLVVSQSPISFYRCVSRFEVFQTKVVHFRFCLVRLRMPLLTRLNFQSRPSESVTKYRALEGGSLNIFNLTWIGNQEKGVFRRGVFAKCAPLLAVPLWVPNVLLGPISLGIFGFLGRDSRLCRNPLC